MKIRTENHGHDNWSAIDDDHYDGRGSPMGIGITEEDAIQDLLEQLADRAKDQAKEPV